MTTHKNSRKHSKKMKGGDSSLYNNYNYINTPKKENESWLPDFSGLTDKFSGFTDKFSGLSDSVTNFFKNNNNSNNYNYTPQTGGKQRRTNKSKRNHNRKTYKRR